MNCRKCQNCDFKMTEEPIIDRIYSQITMQIESEEEVGIEYTCPLCGRIETEIDSEGLDYEPNDFYLNE